MNISVWQYFDNVIVYTSEPFCNQQLTHNTLNIHKTKKHMQEQKTQSQSSMAPCKNKTHKMK